MISGSHVLTAQLKSLSFFANNIPRKKGTRLKPRVTTQTMETYGLLHLHVYNIDMKLFYFRLTIYLLVSFGCFSISQAQDVEDSTEYLSQYDKSLTFKKMTFLPTQDNVNGVYAKSVDETLEALIQKNYKWDFISPPVTNQVINPEDLIKNNSLVKSFTKDLKADGFFVCDVRKDPKQISIHLYLFSASSGLLVAEDNLQRPSDNTEIVQTSVISLMARIIEKIPYDALVLSRTDNRVTINAGSLDGVTSGQTLTAIKVIGAKKHPVRNFIIKSRKAILGQIRIVKVDERLSFGDILTETEAGVIGEDAKITGISSVRYESTPWTKTYTPPEQLLSENNKSVFGKNAQEWIAKNPPTFGKVGADFSIGNFDNNLALADGTNLNSGVSAYPRIKVAGEIWITPSIYTDAYFAQGIGQSDNPGGGTSEVSASLTQYRLSFGYNFILRNEFFGPKLTFDLGFSNYRMFIDTTSNSGFTTLQYRSLPIGIGGYVPINNSRTWAIGGKAYFHFFPRLNETPFSSGGNPESTINEFKFYAENKISQRLRWRIGLEFLLLSTTYSGQGGRTTPANNLSHRYTLLNTGIDYLF